MPISLMTLPITEDVPCIFRANIVTDYGAVGDGTTDNIDMFMAFNADARSQPCPVQLTIPPGTYLIVGFDTERQWSANIADLTVYATGATLVQDSRIGGFRTFLDGDHDFLIQTATAGSSSVQLVTLSEQSNFSIGDYVFISAIDLMAFAFPANNYYFEWNRITSIAPATGTITLENPLQYTYKSTYPRMHATDTWLGGPASIFNIRTDGLGRITWNGGTIDGNTAETSTIWGCRSAEMNHVTFTNTRDIAPSQAEELIFNNCTFEGIRLEFDKLVTYMEFNNCTISSDDTLIQSSNCAQLTRFNNCTFTSEVIFIGTPYELEMRNCSMPFFRVGPNFGWTTRVYLENCAVTTEVGKHNLSVLLSSMTYEGSGVFRRPISSGPVHWMVPGAIIGFSNTGGAMDMGQYFECTDLTQDGTDVLYHTTLPGAIPSIAGGQNTSIKPIPCGEITAINCTGVEMAELSENTPGRKMFERVHRTLTTNWGTSGSPPAEMIIWGEFVELRVNVTQAYTGVQGTLTMNVCGPSLWMYRLDTLAFFSFQPIVNVKIAGERVITPAGVTGAQAGDTLAAPPADIWFARGINPILSADINGESSSVFPIVEITLRTDQG
jgi:hypothetical protein